MTIPIHLAVEDELTEWVARRVLAERSAYYVNTVYSNGGYGYLKKKASAFNNAAKGCPFLLLTDLDTKNCPIQLINEWLNQPRHPDLLFRVAVKEVESWLLGDISSLTSFLNLRSAVAILNPEAIADPKAFLLDLALKCPKRDVRDALVYRDKNSGRLQQGPDYNGTLSRFVNESWSVQVARGNCPSLDKFIKSLEDLEGRRAAKLG